MLPPENLTTLEGLIDGMDAVLVQNHALKNYRARDRFPWFLYLRIFYRDKLPNKLPAPAEQKIIDQFEDELAAEIKRSENAVFIGKTTWNGVREIVFQVKDPERVNNYLTEIIEQETEIRGFDFEMKKDPAWENAGHFFNY